MGLVEEYHYSVQEMRETLDPILSLKDSKTLKQEKYQRLVSFLGMKYNLLQQYCTYLSFYLLLKADGKSTEWLKEHPVLFKIASIKQLLDSLSPIQGKLERQIKKLLKKAKREGEKKDKARSKMKKMQDLGSEEDDEGSEINMEDYEVEEISNPENEEYEGESEDEYGQEEGEDEMEEGEFEMDEDDFGESSSERYDRADGISMNVADLEKLYEIKNGKVVKREGVVNKFESVVPKKQEKEKPAKRKEAKPQVTADLLEVKTVEKKNKRKNENDEDDLPVKKQRVTFNNLAVASSTAPAILNENIEGDELYEQQKQRLRDKKAEKKQLKQELKEQALVGVQSMSKDIQRNINYDIMKAKGLTRKRKKIDRNSRVKFREKFRKAEQKRKSRVQDYKEGPRGVYAGEATGLKAGLIKSTGLN